MAYRRTESATARAVFTTALGRVGKLGSARHDRSGTYGYELPDHSDIHLDMDGELEIQIPNSQISSPDQHERSLAELTAVRAWMANERDPDQLAVMLWDRSFLTPSSVLGEVAQFATCWSAELVMSVARSPELLDALAARGEDAVPVVTTARAIARDTGWDTVADLQPKARRELVAYCRWLRFLTLVLDHSLLGADEGLIAPLRAHEFLDQTMTFASYPTVEQYAVSLQLRARIEEELAVRQQPAMYDVIALITSPRLRPEGAVNVVDLLIRSGLREREVYKGYAGAPIRDGACLTRQELRLATGRAVDLGITPEHWLFILALLLRIGPESPLGLIVLAHCWRIDPELLLGHDGHEPLVPLSDTGWSVLIEEALDMADPLSLELVEQTIDGNLHRLPSDHRLRELAASHVRYRGRAQRAASLRMLELIAMRTPSDDTA